MSDTPWEHVPMTAALESLRAAPQGAALLEALRAEGVRFGRRACFARALGGRSDERQRVWVWLESVPRRDAETGRPTGPRFFRVRVVTCASTQGASAEVVAETHTRVQGRAAVAAACRRLERRETT